MLVQGGGPQETRHLLLFRGIARKRKGVAQTGEDKPVMRPSMERRKRSVRLEK